MTIRRILSAATTNATLVAAGNQRLDRVALTNVALTARFLKVYDKATPPTVGTDVPVATWAIPAGGSLNLSNLQMYFSLGLGFALTGLVPDADVTALALNDVVGILQHNSAAA